MTVEYTHIGRRMLNKTPFYENVLLRYKSRLMKSQSGNIAGYIRDHCNDPLPHTIELETINRCNGSCSFCPNSSREDQRAPAYMADDLFHKILGDLASVKYFGTLRLSLNNEPLLDHQIVERCYIARSKLPYAFVTMYTNGTLLNVAKYHALMESLDLLIIDNYDDGYSLHINIQQCRDAASPDELKRTKIKVRAQDEMLDTRGGLASNRKKLKRPYECMCILPFAEMFITPTGKAFLCPNDPYAQIVLGDLANESIKDVWNGKAYSEVRQAMFYRVRYATPRCEQCDTLRIPEEEVIR